jgi:hypothetical protein
VKEGTLLQSIGSNKLADRVMRQHIGRLDGSWLGLFAEKIGINALHYAMTPQAIEEAWRKACNEKAMDIFFDKFSRDMKRDEHLLLNCDETHISSRQQLTVLGLGGRPALQKCQEQ